MSTNPPGNAAQIDYWNATAGQTWAAFQAQLDRQLEPLGVEAMRVLAPAPGDHILDIGCGCGHTSFALAERVRPSGTVVGVDISQPMLTVARGRSQAPNPHAPDFRQADAQTDDLGTAAFDGAFSPLRGHVLQRSGGGLRQHSPGTEACWPAGFRLLAVAR